eukprot:TRINITY_DN3790_c0_g1_i1.p1 TRINITY_DN3790_c0_g1~~TRINITY_DN3790_c0_g1_i1.p1  ORF type:complete len:155 (+),score=27.83 TRINITY_DN3790_c0_g1_i1:73-537(+)
MNLKFVPVALLTLCILSMVVCDGENDTMMMTGASMMPECGERSEAIVRHVAVLLINETATEKQIQEMADAFAELPKLQSVIDSGLVRSFKSGLDAALEPEKNDDFAIVIDFNSAEDYLAWVDQEDHVNVVMTYARPIVIKRTAVQFWTCSDVTV